MKIGYRRCSGKIILSESDAGARGSWFEKRICLLKHLESRGHVVELLSKTGKSSDDNSKVFSNNSGYEVIIFEFSGNNILFNKKDLEETKKIIDTFDGVCLFVCDDPDLPLFCKDLPNIKNQKWFGLYNAKYPDAYSLAPACVKPLDFPVSTIQALYQKPLAVKAGQSAVYYGRPNGRKKAIKDIIVEFNYLKICGKKSEWQDLGVAVLDPPSQDKRQEFYNNFCFSITLADSLHKKMGWRTGRAYHSVFGGCPSVVTEDHVALLDDGFLSFRNVSQLENYYRMIMKDISYKEKLVSDSFEKIKSQQKILNQTMQEIGL